MQQVNFFHARFRPQQDFLSTGRGVLYLLSLAMVLVVGSAVLWLRLAAQQAKWEQHLAEVKRESVNTMRSAQAMACKTALADVVRLEIRPDPFHIASLLEQFTTIHVPGVWLTGVEVAQAGTELLFQGAALARWPERLPQFVRAVAQQQALAGYHLSFVQLENANKANPFPSPVASVDSTVRLPAVPPVAGLVESVEQTLVFRLTATVTVTEGSGPTMAPSTPEQGRPATTEGGGKRL